MRRGDDALDILRAVPALLGADEPRTYFLAFTTPSEVRGLGGFMGLYAEITADDGRIEMSKFSRAEVLRDETLEASGRDVRSSTGPEEWLDRYSRFGFAGPSSPPETPVGTWLNVTMSPDPRATSEVIAQLYPHSGGRDRSTASSPSTSSRCLACSTSRDRSSRPTASRSTRTMRRSSCSTGSTAREIVRSAPTCSRRCPKRSSTSCWGGRCPLPARRWTRSGRWSSRVVSSGGRPTATNRHCSRPSGSTGAGPTRPKAMLSRSRSTTPPATSSTTSCGHAPTTTWSSTRPRSTLDRDRGRGDGEPAAAGSATRLRR